MEGAPRGRPVPPALRSPSIVHKLAFLATGAAREGDPVLRLVRVRGMGVLLHGPADHQHGRDHLPGAAAGGRRRPRQDVGGVRRRHRGHRPRPQPALEPAGPAVHAAGRGELPRVVAGAAGDTGGRGGPGAGHRLVPLGVPGGGHPALPRLPPQHPLRHPQAGGALRDPAGGAGGAVGPAGGGAPHIGQRGGGEPPPQAGLHLPRHTPRHRHLRHRGGHGAPLPLHPPAHPRTGVAMRACTHDCGQGVARRRHHPARKLLAHDDIFGEPGV
mmetsp:Transcript_19762/g.43208  ORF Transcript_19762/g.43208 Transcript_19762/m.43208 type:complete len:271 (+) Transcript_19762:525-1337(+)